MSETHELGIEHDHDHDVVDTPVGLDQLGLDGSLAGGPAVERGEPIEQSDPAAAPESTDDAQHDDVRDTDEVDEHEGDQDEADDSEGDEGDEDDSEENEGEEGDEDDSEDDEGDDVEGDDDAVAAPSGARRTGRVAQLEREGEVAADFLERLLDIADLDGDIDVDIDGDRAAVAVVDSDEGRVPRRLVGPDGRVLESLQELTRLAVQTATGERSRLMLDVAGYRAERRATLVKLARAAIDEVRDSGQAKALANMTAFERKVVHDEVTAAGLRSESEGVEPHRHIVISPA